MPKQAFWCVKMGNFEMLQFCGRYIFSYWNTADYMSRTIYLGLLD